MEPAHNKPGAVLRRNVASVWREVLLPAVVALGVLLIVVALIEGESAGDFLYAIF